MHKLLIAFLFFALLLPNVWANFVDIEDHPYQEAIIQLTNEWIITGFPENTFNPQRAITRAEILKIVMEAAHIQMLENNEACFHDVALDKRYSDYICTAVEQGIVKWYDDGSFRPENPVLFSEGLKITLETFGIETTTPYDDDPRYQGYLDFVHNNTIFSKYNLYPEDKMTRAELTHLAAAIINQGNSSWSNVRDNRSVWCSASKPSRAPSTIMLNGVERSIITDIWNRYNQNKPAKLFVWFHGRTNPNTMVRSYYGVDKAWDGNTIFVYPLGLPEEWPNRSRQDSGDPQISLRDYELFDEIVQEISENYCIDMDEIYVIWHSLGGVFTNNIGCARGNIIRGIGSVGGSMTIKPEQCSGPVSAIIMHNPEDNLAYYEWGVAARDKLLQQNQCDPDNYTALINNPNDWNCVQYNSCIDGNTVTRCISYDATELGGYHPHKWPNFAAKLMRDFFKQL